MSITPRKTKGAPSFIDIHVGQQLRVRRSLLGISQEKLAKNLGITFQQVQKYERGTNRVSAGRLYQLSQFLDAPVDYFYTNLPKNSENQPEQNTAFGFSDNEQEAFIPDDIMSRKETLDLVRIYYTIKNPGVRKDVLKLIKSMAKNTD